MQRENSVLSKPVHKKSAEVNFKSLFDGKNIPEHKSDFLLIQEKITNGISHKEFVFFKRNTKLDYDILASVLGVSKPTLINTKTRYSNLVSDKLYRLAELYSFGYEVFENREDFNDWMITENASLGNKKPISFLTTSYGIDEVRNLIGRIEYGVYS
jgi:putative toxin-antitoxin system antitoxin component (TIGR02293 family)